jgi:hypothetical protein
MVRGRTQPSTKPAQTPRAAIPRPRAASGHSSVPNAAGINGTPLLTCHQIISGQPARTNSAAPSRLHANKRQRLRIISPNPPQLAPGFNGQSHKPGDKAVIAITKNRIRFVNRTRTLIQGAIDERHTHPSREGMRDLVGGGEFVDPALAFRARHGSLVAIATGQCLVRLCGGRLRQRLRFPGSRSL